MVTGDTEEQGAAAGATTAVSGVFTQASLCSGNNKANTRTVSYCLSDEARSINQESYVFDPLITRKDEE